MIPKPKELTGKALPFIDVIRTLSIGSLENSNSVEEWVPFVSFYSQPFTPELLIELFEGWVESSKNYYEMEEHPDVRVSFEKTIEFQSDYAESLIFCNIQTLSDFITLCNLAGVKLKWKEK